MNILLFPNIAAFNKWHKLVIKQMGLPIINHNAGDGRLQPDKQQTIAYTHPIPHPNENDSRIIAFAEENIQTKYAEVITHSFAVEQGWFAEE